MCIVASTAHASHRQIVSGVVDYVDRHVDWETILFSSLDDFHKFRTTGGPVKADGMLAGVGQVRDIEAVRSDRYPTVLMGFGARGFPSVQSDELAIGEMACEHFLRLGMRHLACCGLPRVGFAEQRMAAFVAHAARQGLTVQTYPRPVYAEITQHPHELRHLHKWLKSLPQSVGLFCPVTNISAVVLRQCRHLGIAVPEQVALLGVDDDEILCSLSHPRLSAVDQAPERIGYEAAAMLNRILSGARAPAEPILIKPRSVIARASTDIINSDNPYVAQAIRFIRDHVEDGINVSDVMRAVPMSRRGLERGFLRNIGRSIHDEIVRSRVDQARRFLDQTDMSLADIAARCGFSYPTKLSAVFRRVVGASPGEYRRSGGVVVERKGGRVGAA